MRKKPGAVKTGRKTLCFEERPFGESDDLYSGRPGRLQRLLQGPHDGKTFTFFFLKRAYGAAITFQ